MLQLSPLTKVTLLRGFSGLIAQGLSLLGSCAYFACSSTAGNTMGPPSAQPPVATGGNSSVTVQSIRFIPSDTVLLKPGATETRKIEVLPPGDYHIGLALLGNSVDAALSQGQLHTLDGTSEFSITASSVPAVFEVRASVETLVNVLQVSVSNQGFATVNVTGNYKGTRQASEWVASLQTGVTCGKLGNQFPGDGSFATTSHDATPVVQITDVSILPDTSVAVLLRGDYLMWGCTDLPLLTPNQALDLPVELYDTPVSYGSDAVEATFVLDSAADEWAHYLDTVEPEIVAGFSQSATTDADLLLSAMTSSVGAADGQIDFNQRRQAGAWDSIVGDWSTATCSGSQCLRDSLKRWLSTGAASITQGSSIDARLSLSASSVSLNLVQLTLESMKGLAAGAWVTSTQVPLGGPVGANDELRGSTYFSFNDGLFLRLLAQLAASSEYPEASDIPEAQSMMVDCEQLAIRLNGAAPDTSSSCGASCLAQLCKTALRNLWTNTEAVARARASSKLELYFTGKLRLDSHAVAIGCDGTWLGAITAPDGSQISVGGTVH